MEIELDRRTTTATDRLPIPAQRPPADAAPSRAAAPLATEDLPVVEEILEAAVSLMIELDDRDETERLLEALHQRLGAAQVAEGGEPTTLPVLIEELALLKSAVQRLRGFTARADLVPLAEQGRRVLRYLHVGLGRGRTARSLRGLPVWADGARTAR
ncbi:hypothetical protein [Streptomyces sp. NPDC052496]|uniref:hypothetical protein n=1 Tax=Streptomyces sp. NPDC052496 TaxID=3154951 RepID=UPI003439C9C2